MNFTGFGHFVKGIKAINVTCTRDLQDDDKELAGFMASLSFIFGVATWMVLISAQITDRITFKLIDVENSQCLKGTHNNMDCAFVLARMLEQAILVNPRPRNKLTDRIMQLAPDLESRKIRRPSLKARAKRDRKAEQEEGAVEAPMEEH